jgi:hypothetical protein
VGRRGSFNFVTALLLVSTGLAATLQPTSIEELAQQADLIILGSVQRLVPSTRDPEAPTTRVVIRVTQSWKEQAAPKIELVQPQGAAKGITQAVPGLSTFRRGEEVLVFLVRDPEGAYTVLQGAHGKLSVLRQGRKGKAVVTDVAGAERDLAEILIYLRKLIGSDTILNKH